MDSVAGARVLDALSTTSPIGEEKRREKRMKGPKLTGTLRELPESIINEILGRLPIRDAARTSVLSRPWRYRWRFMSDLDLSALSDPLTISQVLLLHQGPLRRFEAQAPPHNSLASWLSSLFHRSSASLRSLALTTDRYFDTAAFSLNPLASYFPNLTHLRLESCSFSLSPSSFNGFPNLRSLHIRGRGEDSFVPHLYFLISTCPLLEQLFLIDVDMKDHHLDIVAPNLRLLKIVESEPAHFSITNAPLIETAVFKFQTGNKSPIGSCNLVGVLGAMPSVRKLGLDDYFLKSCARDLKRNTVCMPVTVPISPQHLRFMSLQVYFESRQQVSLTLCLLRSFRNLEELEIRGCYYSEDYGYVGDEFWKAQENLDALDQLESVKMTMIEGVRCELKFLRFLLARALRLKTLTITFLPWSQKCDKAKTKLLEFPRASNRARILLIDTNKTKMEQAEEW